MVGDGLGEGSGGAGDRNGGGFWQGLWRMAAAAAALGCRSGVWLIDYSHRLYCRRCQQTAAASSDGDGGGVGFGSGSDGSVGGGDGVDSGGGNGEGGGCGIAGDGGRGGRCGRDGAGNDGGRR